MVEKFKDIFTSFDTIHERDKRTDGQTLHNGTRRGCISSCEKNELVKTKSSY